MSKRFFYLWLMFGLFCVPLISAQLTSGTISGSVKDSTGALLPGVTITVTNSETGIKRSAETDDEGQYRLSNLSLGKYEVQAELPGFQVAVRTGIVLTLGREAIVDLALQVGEISEKVVVTGEAALVETRSTVVGGLVDTTQIENLPLNGRSFIDLAILQQGVSISTFSGQGSGQGFGQRIAISGARPTDASYTLDGQDINDHMNAVGTVTGGAAGVDAIREFKVVTNPFSAEYGKLVGGEVQVVTKSGTNELHGSIYQFHRNDNLDAANFFTNQSGTREPEFKRNQFGGSLGGPIVKNKTFFFGNYEGLREGLGVTAISVVPDRNARQGLLRDPRTGNLANIGVHPAVRPYLDLYPLPNVREFGDGRGDFAWTSTTTTKDDFFVVRIDHNFERLLGLGTSNSFHSRYALNDGDRSSPRNVIVDTIDKTRMQYLTFGLDTVVSPRVINRFLLAYNRSFIGTFNVLGASVQSPPSLIFTNSPLQGVGGFSVTSLSDLGGDTLIPRHFLLNTYQSRDDVTIAQGNHSLSLGYNIEKFENNLKQTFFLLGGYTFSDLTAFLRGTPNTFSAMRPGGNDPFRTYSQWLFAWYIQDDIRVSDRLHLNLGLRHEWITVPVERFGRLHQLRNYSDRNADPLRDPVKGFFKNPSEKNFAPRIGLAWDPTGSGRSSIRAGFGVFYSQLINWVWRLPAMQNPPFWIRGAMQSIDGPINFPNAFTTQDARLGGALAVDLFDPNPSQPTMLQYNLNIQREMVPGMVLTLDYAGSHGYHQARKADWNLRIPEILPDGRYFFGPGAPIFNPRAERIWIRTTNSNSLYNAFRTGLNRRLAEGLALQLSYTVSKTIDDMSNTQGATDFPGDFGDPPRSAPPGYMPVASDARGLTPFDVRQNFVFNFSYDLPGHFSGVADKILGGWSTNGILRLSSGTPFEVRGTRASNGRAIPRWGFVTTDGPPSLVTGKNSNSIRPQNPNQYFDPTVFELPPPGFFGNLGRNTVVSPGIAKFDFSLFKSTVIHEKVKVQFRAEFFNILNRTNFALPQAVLFDTQTLGIRPDAGKITATTTTAREIQFGLRIVF